MHLPLPARVLSKLIQVIGYVSSSREDIFEIAAGQILELFDVDACLFAIAEKDGTRLAAVTSKDPKVRLSIMGKGCPGPCRTLKTGILNAIEDSSVDPGCPEGLVSNWAGSHMCIPLTIRGERLGVMTVAAKSTHFFTPEEIDLYLAVASLVAIAVQNAEMYSISESHAAEMREQVREKTRIIRAINHISERINASVSREQVFEAVKNEISDVIACDRVTIALTDAEDRVDVSLVCGLWGASKTSRDIPLADTVLAELAKTGKARMQNGDPPPAAACLVGCDARSYAVAPLMVGNRMLGSLNFARTSGPNLKHSELPNLAQIAGQVAAALRRIELFEREKNAVEELETLYDASQALTSTVRLRDTLKIIGRQLAIATGSESSLLFKNESGRWSLVASHGGSVDRVHPSLRVALPAEVVNAAITAKSYAQANQSEIATGWLKTLADHLGPNIMLAPIRERDNIMALAVVARAGAPYNEADLRIATAIAGQAAVAIQASQVYEHERTIAEAFQKSLLPPPDYRRSGLCVASRYQAALEEAEVGGDFFDIIEIDDSRVGIAIGDISGKGLVAATQAAATKYMLEAYALEDPSPSQVLSRLNNAACMSMNETFVTLFYGVVDSADGTLIYANAGHEMPIRIKDGIPADPLDVTGPALAVYPNAQYGIQTIEMGERDLVLCYTDGITEARRGKGIWGYEGLVRALKQCHAVEPRAVVDHVFERALEYSRGRLADDVILLAMSHQ
ncbi:MAG: SpoIIE family protein phosphatase [Armatimonadota bacterium]|nr:SpoIIE family protein phosphatase [Armatimonadota bacterium]